jgi:hypothetical protein
MQVYVFGEWVVDEAPEPRKFVVHNKVHQAEESIPDAFW